MSFSRLDMDHDLLGVGSWIDVRAASQPSITRPHERGSVRHYLPPLAETDRHGPSLKGAEYIKASRESHDSEPSKSEDELPDGTTRDAIGESRVVQTVKAEGRQQGNRQAVARLVKCRTVASRASLCVPPAR